MTWFVFMLLTVVFDSAIILVQKKWTTKKSHNSLVSGALYQVVVASMIAIYAYVSGNLNISLDLDSWIIIGAAGVLFTITSSLWYFAIERISASTTTIVISSRSIFAVLLGFILLGEVVTFKQFGGMILILAGVIYSQYSSHIDRNMGHILTLLLIAFTASVGNIIDRIATRSINIYTYLILAFMIPGLLMLVIQRIRHKKIDFHITPEYLYHIGIVSLLIAIGSICFILGLKNAPSTALAIFVNQTKVVLTVILAAMFLHERGHLKQKVISSIMCLGGLYLLN